MTPRLPDSVAVAIGGRPARPATSKPAPSTLRAFPSSARPVRSVRRVIRPIRRCWPATVYGTRSVIDGDTLATNCRPHRPPVTLNDGGDAFPPPRMTWMTRRQRGDSARPGRCTVGPSRRGGRGARLRQASSRASPLSCQCRRGPTHPPLLSSSVQRVVHAPCCLLLRGGRGCRCASLQ